MISTCKVSVCLATYNGQRFIVEQIESILLQLSHDDELIICDDCSLDATRDEVISISNRDPRVCLFVQKSNVGHVRNFEKTITHASGDIIFLSDQDDIWMPGKYREMVDCLVNNPDVQLVHHALSTIDADGVLMKELLNPLQEGRQPRFRYTFRQIIKGQIFGCAVAFRRSLLNVVLPFPSSAYAHDHWLAVASGISGSVYFINKPLVSYRQHSANVTPKNKLPWRRIIYLRLRMLQMTGTAIKRNLKLIILNK